MLSKSGLKTRTNITDMPQSLERQPPRPLEEQPPRPELRPRKWPQYSHQQPQYSHQQLHLYPRQHMLVPEICGKTCMKLSESELRTRTNMQHMAHKRLQRLQEVRESPQHMDILMEIQCTRSR